MSITISSPQEICNAPYNNSTAKMQYSFSKDKRFKDNKQNIDRPFYQVHGKNSKRATNFGYGTKYDFTRDMPRTPPPTSYQIKSMFEKNKEGRKGFGFGNSRQNMLVTGPLAETKNNKNPGPGAYEIPNTRNRCYYSIQGKRVENPRQTSPGPGNYEINSTLNKTGSNIFSKYKDHKGMTFSHSTERFKNLPSQVPGPGNYEYSVVTLNPQGKYSLSKLQNSKVRSFGNAKRKSLNQDLKTPGPGNYRLPSDFGYYGSKKQYVKSQLSRKPSQARVQTANQHNRIRQQNTIEI